MGCRVVGIAGKQEKCDFVVNELGFDACISHLSEDYANELATACPQGIDIYFENVGGKVFEGVVPLLNKNSRISLCGMISQYGNTDGRDTREIWNDIGSTVLQRQQVQVHGLFVGDFVDDYQDRFLSEMAAWIADGRITYKEDFRDGLENAPDAFADMLQGNNFGKTLVRVSAEQV